MEIFRSILNDKLTVENIRNSTTEAKLYDERTIAKAFDSDDFLTKFNNFVSRLLKFVDVPEFTDREYYDYQESDFSDVATNFVAGMEFLLAVMKNCPRAVVKSLYEANSAYFVLLIFSHFSINLWTSSESVEKSRSCMTILADSFDIGSFYELITNTKDACSSSGYYRFLKVIQKRFSKESWKKNPVIVSVFVASLRVISFPHLSSYTDLILQPCLIMNDDYEVKHKILATTSLRHIINNVTSTELLWQGRIHVIYDALKHNLHLRKCTLSKVTLDCMLLTLNVMEKDVKRYDTVKHCPKHHEIFGLILHEAEMESNWDMRRAYSEYSSQFIHIMGLHVVRHSATMMNMFKNYLEITDTNEEMTRLFTLETVSLFMGECRPRVPGHCETLLQVLLKLLYELSTADCDKICNKKLCDKSIACVKKLCDICPDICTETLQSVIALQCNEKYSQYLTSVLTG